MNIAFFANPEGRHDCKWINELSKEHHCIIICTENGNKEQFKINDNINVYPILPNIFPLFRFNQINKTKQKIKSLLSEQNIDICHSMYAYPYSYWPAELNFDKHILTTRGSDMLIDLDKTLSSGNNIKQIIAHFFLKTKLIAVLKSVKHITSTSSRQTEIIKKHIGNTSKCEVIYTGIDLDKIDRHLLQKERMTKDEYIFSPRSMARIYNLELIIKAFALFTKDNPKIKLVQIDDRGETEYSIKIKTLVKDLNLNDKVIFVESLTLPEMINCYNNSLVTVMVPNSDGTPNSALEAIYSESLLILGNLPYDELLFNENTCFKLKTNQPIELSKMISDAINNPKVSFAKQAKEIIKEHIDIKLSLNKINIIYKSINQG